MISSSRTSTLLRSLTTAATLAWSCTATHAQTVSEGHFSYAIGSIRFLETPRAVMMFKGDKLIGYSNILAGGWISPAISTSEDGRIHWGDQEFDSAHGNQVKPSLASRCLAGKAKNPGVLTTAQDHQAVVVTPVTDADDRTVAYASETFQLPSCKLTRRQQIGPSDIDHFFELGASKSGLWLVGSAAEGTLLLRSWSSEWIRVPPPPEINGILSAHWSSDGKLWVLSNRLIDDQLKPELFTSDDMGKNWNQQPFLKTRLPSYWLEAVRQISAETPELQLP